MITEPKDILIRLLNKYLSKPHILMKEPMRYYLSRLQSGQNLKPSHLRSITPYLKWDLKMTERQVQDFFFELTRPHRTPPQPHPINTLETFL